VAPRREAERLHLTSNSLSSDTGKSLIRSGGFLRQSQLRDDAELLRHPQRIQVDPLFVDSPPDQPVGSALAVSWSGNAEQFAPVDAVYSVAAHDCVALCKV
jgi:hypothetical protein